MNRWDLVKLEEVALVTDFSANGSFADLRNNVPYKSNPDYAILVRLVDFNASWNGNFVYVNEHSYKFLKKSYLNPGDVVIANIGANAGTVFRVPNLGQPMTLGPNALVIKTDKFEKTDKNFLYYYFSSQVGQNQVSSIITGSAQPKFTKTDFRNLKIPLPPLPEQRAIADVLGALDDKIELNRRMNETLEGLARALFKSWFVDFDPVRRNAECRMQNAECGTRHPEDALFPSAFDGDVPQGWKVGRLRDVGRIICGKTPPTSEKENYDGEVPFITIPDMHRNIFVTKTNKTLSEKGIRTQANKMLPAFSICVSCIATPGLVSLTTIPSQTNQQINSLVPNDNKSHFYFYWALYDLADEIRARGSGGSVVVNLNKSQFEILPILIPPLSVIHKYHEFVEPLFQKILINEKQSRTLAALRDALLPRLMSGEVRVKDKG